MMRLKRFVVAGAVVAATAALIVPAATAVPPVRVPLPLPDITGAFCPGFDVLLHADQNKEVATIFSNGAVIVTGTFKIQATNMSNHKTIDVNASGPVFVTSDGNTQVLRGNSLIIGEAGDLGPGSPPTLQLVSGVVTITSGPDGAVTGVTQIGHTTDLGAILADPTLANGGADRSLSDSPPQPLDAAVSRERGRRGEKGRPSCGLGSLLRCRFSSSRSLFPRQLPARPR